MVPRGAEGGSFCPTKPIGRGGAFRGRAGPHRRQGADPIGTEGVRVNSEDTFIDCSIYACGANAAAVASTSKGGSRGQILFTFAPDRLEIYWECKVGGR